MPYIKENKKLLPEVNQKCSVIKIFLKIHKIHRRNGATIFMELKLRQKKRIFGTNGFHEAFVQFLQNASG